MKRVTLLLVFVVGLMFLSTWAGAQTKSVKIAYFPCGRVNDKSWGEAGYVGAVMAKKELEEKGYEVDLKYSESVPVSKVEAAARDYASRGFSPVLLH